EGPAGLDALAEIEPGTKVALQAATSPAGFQYPVVNMREQGIDTDSDIEQIPVEGNNNAVLAVHNGDAEIGFAYWDARVDVLDEAPDVADDVVAFAYTDMIPNGGVAVSPDLPDDVVQKLTELMDEYVDSSDEAESVMFDLVGLSDWTTDTAQDEVMRYGEVLEQFAQCLAGPGGTGCLPQQTPCSPAPARPLPRIPVHPGGESHDGTGR